MILRYRALPICLPLPLEKYFWSLFPPFFLRHLPLHLTVRPPDKGLYCQPNNFDTVPPFRDLIQPQESFFSPPNLHLTFYRPLLFLLAPSSLFNALANAFSPGSSNPPGSSMCFLLPFSSRFSAGQRWPTSSSLVFPLIHPVVESILLYRGFQLVIALLFSVLPAPPNHMRHLQVQPDFPNLLPTFHLFQDFFLFSPTFPWLTGPFFSIAIFDFILCCVSSRLLYCFSFGFYPLTL